MTTLGKACTFGVTKRAEGVYKKECAGIVFYATSSLIWYATWLPYFEYNFGLSSISNQGARTCHPIKVLFDVYTSL